MQSRCLLPLIVLPVFLLGGCTGESPAIPTPTPKVSTATPIPTTPATVTSTVTPTPEGRTIIVASTANDGEGTLRQAIRDAQPGDRILFDPSVFPPDRPATILLSREDAESALPALSVGGVTIDASGAGVILDGRNAEGSFVSGLEIYSDGNTVMGLQLVNFSGIGIIICGGSRNRIGGDRAMGAGPIGEGNLSSRNATGIDLCGAGTSDNIITGNLIGTDPTGNYQLAVDEFWVTNEWGNRYDGIWIENGPNRNTIGPANTIAFNRYNGIRISDPYTNGNRILENSIHDNAGAGIQLSDGGNGRVQAPVIQVFDPAEGTVSGTACPGCVVEIYSDKNSEGKVFEGRTVADAAGKFALDKGSAFQELRLSALATNPFNNSSAFSGSVGPAAELQEGNNLPKTALRVFASNQLADNRIGSMWHSLYFVTDDELSDMLDENLGMGQTRYRVSVNNGDSSNAYLFWDRSEFAIEPQYDDFITRLSENGVRVTYQLTFWDKEFQDAGGILTFPRFHSEDQVERWLEYVKFIVGHFRGRVSAYEIWNEPSFRSLPMQWIQPEDYLRLIERTIPVSRQMDPDAKILTGGTHNLLERGARDYLFTLLRSRVMPLVDGVDWHPLYGASPEYDSALREYYYGYPSLLQEIKDTATAHGFQGEFHADEIYWRPPETAILGDPWSGASSEMKAAKYMARGIVMHLGADVSVTLQDTGNIRRPPLVSQVVRNLCTLLTGNRPADLPRTIQSDGARIRSYGFTLPNGDELLAVWNDGGTVEYDAGLASVITFPGRAGWKAVAVDVLNGLEQALNTEEWETDLVIRGFLIHDYPIFIRLRRMAGS